MTSFARKIHEFIVSEQLLTPGASVIVGLSGGADSTALLAVLTELGYMCLAVHCNFGLRGAEAERDMDFSRTLAEGLDVPFEAVRFDVPAYMKEHGVSVEMACRDLRYDYFRRRTAEIGEVEAIAVGHHVEDNVETFFLNLLRGSGLHGLRGMLPKHDAIVRPLLGVTKTEILQYLDERGLSFVEDSSNAANEFKRNRLRNIVLPALEGSFPGATEAVAKSMELLRANERLYLDLMPEELPESLAGVSPVLIYEFLAPMGFNYSQCEDISRSGAGAVFRSRSHRLTLCPGGKYHLSSLDTAIAPPGLHFAVYPNDENFKPERGVLYLDKAHVAGDAVWDLRPWRPGDRMIPFGMTGSRAVSDILADAGVPASVRKDSYVLTLNGEIVWVVGIRASNLYKVRPETTNILEIRHEKI